MKKLLTTIIAIIFFSVSFNVVSAQGLVKPKTASSFANQVQVSSGLTPVSLGLIIARVIQVALGLLSIIFLALTLVAGFRWMTAGGNEEEIKKAQSSIRSALIGLIIVLAAWGIVYFVFTYLPFSGGTFSGSQGGTSGG